MKIKIDDIEIGTRIRRSPGDLTDIADSMKRVGLLQPILVDPRNRLLAGFRRLEAAKMLGWDSIEARMVDVADRKESLQIESDENKTRLDFTTAESKRAEKLLTRHSRRGIFWKIFAWFSDLFDRIVS